ncbi:MAG: DinB family protein [Ferruginibacter sp.]
MVKIYKPTSGYDSFYQPYLDCVPDDGDLLQHLKDIQVETETLINRLPEEKLAFRYSENKWTIRDILVHLGDCERIITYRALRIARGDQTNLPGFDENLFVSNAGACTREVDGILKELALLREATIAFIETLSEDALNNTGTANNFAISARLMVNHIYGHQRHHLNIIRERYL